MDDISKQVTEFLLKFFPKDAPDHLVMMLWHFDPKSKQSGPNFPATRQTLTNVVNMLLPNMDLGLDLYFTPSLRDATDVPRGKRGGLDTCRTLTAYVCEIDVGTEGHRNGETNPPTFEEARKVLGDRTPTYLVKSGGGYHVYSFLDEPIVFDTAEEAQKHNLSAETFVRYFGDQALALGYDADTDKFGLERVWRIPHTLNNKLEEPRPVVLEQSNPAALYEYTKPQKPINTATGQELSQKVVNPRKLENTLTKHPDPSLRKHFKAIYRGAEVCKKGRHNMLASTTMSMVIHDRGRSAPEALGTIYVGTFQAWEDKGQADAAKELIKVVGMLKSAQGKYFAQLHREDQEAKQKVQAAQDNLASALADKAPEGRPRYLIGKSGGKNYFPFDFETGEYTKFPVVGTLGLTAHLAETWSPDTGCPVTLVKKDENGKVVDKTVVDLAKEYMFEVVRLQSGYDVQSTLVTGRPSEGVLTLPTAPYNKDIFPEENPDIQQWLDLLAGNDPELQRLFRIWCAGAYRQDLPSCMLYINANGGAGKTTFYQGAGKRWQNPPCEVSEALTKFNSVADKNPIWYVDEAVDDPEGMGNVSAKLRALVSRNQHTIEQKGVDKRYHSGYVRVIVAANDHRALASKRNSDLNDKAKDAVAERILYLKTDDDQAKEFLDQMYKQGTDVREQWQDRGGLARHMLYLCETMREEVSSYPHRFISSLPPEADPYRHEKFALLAPSSEFDTDITIWFEAFFRHVLTGQSRKELDARFAIDDNKLFIQPTAVRMSWSDLPATATGNKAPNDHTVASFMKNICMPCDVKKVNRAGDKAHFRFVLRPAVLLNHLDRTILHPEDALQLMRDIGLDTRFDG